jgi:hypothetical protein
MATPACPAPTASVSSYQLLPQTVSLSIDSLFAHMDYSFTRKVRWVTVVQRFKDQSFEIMPNQVIPMYEFTVRMDRWTPNDATALESFVDSVNGSAYPFHFTAPDDGLVYNVRFKEDEQGYTVPNAAVRTGELTFESVGDINNSIDNDAAYPVYVEDITTTSTTSSSSTSSTSTMTTSPTIPALVAHLFAPLGFSGGTTGSLNTLSANFIVMALTWQGSIVPTVSDSLGNTWTKLATFSVNEGGVAQNFAFWYAKNPTVGAAHSFTAEPISGGIQVGGAYIGMIVEAFSGMAIVSPLSGGPIASSAAGVLTMQAGSLTPSGGAAQLVIAAVLSALTSGVYTIDSGFAIVDYSPLQAGICDGSAMAFLVQSAAAAVNPTWTFKWAEDVVAMIVSFSGG